MSQFNTQNRKRLVLTYKQLKQLLSALRSTSEIRSTEKERAYYRKLLKEIEEQTNA